MAEARERTAAEREAARLERERRRAQTTGGPPSGGPQPPQPSPDTARHEAPPPPESPDLPEPREPPVGLVPEDDGAEPIDWEQEHEVASGTRRVGWRERTAAAVAPARRAHVDPNQPAPRTPSRRSLTIRVISLLALLLAAALLWFCVELFQPFHGSGHGSVTVSIPARSGARQVGDLLARDGVVPSGFFFYLRALLAGDRGKLLAGTYRLQRDMSYGQALKVLTTPPPAAKVSSVTIIPGKTRAEISALLRSQGFHGNYLAATRRSPVLDIAAYGAPRGTPSLEGFLYPDTYQLRQPISVAALVADQLKQFRAQFAKVGLGYARSKRLTPYDVLIVASMIEAEAQTAHDRPLIASVIYNRLHDGTPLQIDATTRYATGNYTRPLTQSELDSQSPYNTRIHKGLPPTPIDSPGLGSIEAAAHPAHTSYLYFVVKPCGNGEHVFASSYSKFQAEVQQYYSARSAHGGRSPTKC